MMLFCPKKDSIGIVGIDFEGIFDQSIFLSYSQPSTLRNHVVTSQVEISNGPHLQYYFEKQLGVGCLLIL